MPKVLALFALALVLTLVPTLAQEAEPVKSDAKADSAAKEKPYQLLVPKAARKEVKAESGASRRLAIRLTTEGAALLELTYKEQRTQTPVVSAAFIDEQCESELSENEWLSRYDADASLCYAIASAPKELGEYRVLVEHFHVTEVGEAKVTTFTIKSPKTFEKNKISVPGLLPGSNLFRLKVGLPDAKGEWQYSKADSHLILVHQNPVQGATCSGSIDAHTHQAGTVALHRAKIQAKIGFYVTSAVAKSKISVTLRRRGFRLFSSASSGGSPFLMKEKQGKSWNTLFVGTLASAAQSGVKLTRNDGGEWFLDFTHIASVTSSHFPFHDSQEYQITISHPTYPRALASFVAKVSGKVDKTGNGDWTLEWQKQAIAQSTVKPEAVLE